MQHSRFQISEAALAGIIDASPDVLLVVDRAGVIRVANERTEEVTGYKPEELVSRNVDMLVPAAYRETHGRHRATYDAGPTIRPMGRGMRLTCQHRNGSCFPVEIKLSPLTSGDERLTVVILRDVTDRRQQELDLEKRTEELARSNRELEQFAYIASHDLQEPLRIVSGYCQLLQRRYVGKLDADADKFINYAVDGALRLQELINDLLAYSRVSTKAKPFNKVNLTDICAQAIANLQIAIAERGAELSVEPLPEVQGDSWQLLQLMQNLIGNAVKFCSHATPKVWVGSRQDGNEWVVWVKDNGIGIDAKYFEKIFTIFQRLHSREKYDGTGIGLAICKKVVHRHGGRIWVESQAGNGATFFFALPLKLAE